MDTSETRQGGNFDDVVAAVSSSRDLVVVAPNSTVNTGTVMGGQRHTVSHLTGSATSAVPLRQGPVRAKYLATARRRFVPPPSFEEALVAVDSGITVLLGDRGTGRETHALNLLAHGGDDPVLVQVDGAVNLSRWRPRSQGVHGYLVMEPPDPFTLRAWDLSCLEAPLAEAKARLIIVLTDAPGLADALTDHLGVPVVRHHPPDARKVFSAHIADDSSDGEACAAWVRALPPGQFDELLPEGLPPRYAARTADAALNLGVTGGASGAEVLRHVALAEGTEAVARAQDDPVLRADLLAVTVYGGLHRGVVAERAEDLLRLAEPGGIRDACAGSSYDHSAAGTRRRLGAETLRLLGARRVRRAGDGITDSVSFFRPAMTEAVWEVLCRDHLDLVPLLHSWLSGPGPEAEQVEGAGRAAAAMAAATCGRSLEHLRDLALAPSRWAPQVAGWCLATAVQDPAAGCMAADLLEQWSVATEAPLRETVVYACNPDRGAVAEDRALRLLQQLLTALGDDTEAVALATAVAETLKQRFEAGDSRARATVLRRMHDWSLGEDVPGLLAALCFPAMVRTDLAWWSDQIRTEPQLISSVVRLAAHALNESSSFGSMHDALVDWCAEGARAGHQAKALSELLAGLVADRQPGFLRWLLAVERSPDSMPGKKLATQAQTAWRAASPVSISD